MDINQFIKQDLCDVRRPFAWCQSCLFNDNFTSKNDNSFLNGGAFALPPHKRTETLLCNHHSTSVLFGVFLYVRVYVYKTAQIMFMISLSKGAIATKKVFVM